MRLPEDLDRRNLGTSVYSGDYSHVRRREYCRAHVYDRSEGEDGYVSLEVSPHLAHETRASIDEARRLSARVGRPNLFIKIPGTAEGVPAVEELIFEGINVNITLLFSIESYEAVAAAYLGALSAVAQQASL